MPPDSSTVGRVGRPAVGPDASERDQLLLAFGDNLRTNRRLASLTQETLTERCFLGAGQISRLEHGKTAPNLLALLLLADATRVEIGQLVSGLAVPSRRASREQILALVTRQPGISTAELAGSLRLPPRYVFRTARRMHSYEEIVWRMRGWQPVLEHTGGSRV
jgi:transcriptional regulator with XRE-family HTH domain